MWPHSKHNAIHVTKADMRERRYKVQTIACNAIDEAVTDYFLKGKIFSQSKSRIYSKIIRWHPALGSLTCFFLCSAHVLCALIGFESRAQFNFI